MKNLKNLLLLTLIAVSYCGCFTAESAENNLLDAVSYNVSSLEETNKNLPTGLYYSFQRDYRKCMSPKCGGYWIKAVNIPETVCADGTIGGANGCYVADFDLNGIELNSNDLVLGEFHKQLYGSTFADHLNLSSAFTPVLSETVPYNQINVIQDSGIRCITTPCISHQIATVNTNDPWTTFKYLFDGTKGQNEEILNKTFSDAYSDGGALVQGQWKNVGTNRQKLIVTNVYTRKKARNEKTFCAFMKKANKNLFRAWNVKTYEEGMNILSENDFEPGTEDISEGTCGAYTTLSCTRTYEPVCGTINRTGETRTFGNLCGFKVAVRIAAGNNGNSRGSWTPGRCPSETEE